jgi:hypothetical protein
MSEVVKQINATLAGWVNYFGSSGILVARE